MAQVLYPNMYEANFPNGRVQADFYIDDTSLDLRRIRVNNLRPVSTVVTVTPPEGSPITRTFAPNSPNNPTTLTIPAGTYTYVRDADGELENPPGWSMQIRSG